MQLCDRWRRVIFKIAFIPFEILVKIDSIQSFGEERTQITRNNFAKLSVSAEDPRHAKTLVRNLCA